MIALYYRKFVYNILTFLLTLTLIMGVSIFTYGTFYFAYMPTEVHTHSLTMMISMMELPRFTRRRSTSSSPRARAARAPAASPTPASSSTPGGTGPSHLSGCL